MYIYIYTWGAGFDDQAIQSLSARNLNGTVEFHGALDIRTTVNPHDHWKSGSATQILRPRCSLAANCWEGLDVAPNIGYNLLMQQNNTP